MIKIDNIKTYNWENAIIGMRHPKKSYNKIDSKFDDNGNLIELGDNDKKLMKKLISAGTEHRKFLRQVFVSMNIKAPLFWWKEMDTYKIGTTANSTSTMHMIHKRPLEFDDFSIDEIGKDESMLQIFGYYLKAINLMRDKYIKKNDKKYWRRMIEMLPSSYNQTRTWTGNYENLINIYFQRKNHKLKEWREFCKVLEEQVPHFKELILKGGDLQ